MELIIREVDGADDFDAIADIYVKSWQAAYRGIVPQNYLDGLKPDGWSALLSKGAFTSFVAVENGNCIGTASVCAARDETKKGWGELVSIYLLPTYFGKGVAEQLFQKAIATLRAQGFSDIYLYVLKENVRARRFYEKHGFSPTADTLQIEISGKPLAEIRYIAHLKK
ncbi:GNAT family N-acetyltransferase [Christensenellaceae bacterium OttesenSCG-928-M15]|nr:GNAT family N-acetyltransferase [Christensenellaceae bacterium OttesenSCG-928-M15]